MKDDRRSLICEAVLDLAASGGNRAVTHGAVDAALGLAKGSTSYYFRTRSELLRAAITQLAARSRAEFDSAVGTDEPVDVIVAQLELLLTERRRDALARYALAPDAATEGVAAQLAGCLFSLPLATDLFESFDAADPDAAARDLISLLEGLLFDRLYGARSLDASSSEIERRADLRRPVALLIAASSGGAD